LEVFGKLAEDTEHLWKKKEWDTGEFLLFQSFHYSGKKISIKRCLKKSA
jgi:hypothetical protein